MGLFARFGKHGAARKRAHNPLWEIASEYPAEPFYDLNESVFDPLGSYTGNPADGLEPEQDADDL